VPEEQRHVIEALDRHWNGERTPGARLVAYVGGQPVGKCFTNLEDLPQWVAIHGVVVKPEARGHGVATALMNEAISRGRAAGARKAILHSSSMALSMYLGMGFVEHRRLPVFATSALFGTHRH
jgi:GNAT superfamily N-acetyltransferase